MTKESKKKEDEIKEAVANCEPPQLAVTYYDRKNINIETLIRTIRGQKVMLDSDLAMLYGVTTSRLNEQVKRNNNRFPDDFMFQLTKEEWSTLKSQIAISSWGGRRIPPHLSAFSQVDLSCGCARRESVFPDDQSFFDLQGFFSRTAEENQTSGILPARGGR